MFFSHFYFIIHAVSFKFHILIALSILPSISSLFLFLLPPSFSQSTIVLSIFVCLHVCSYITCLSSLSICFFHWISITLFSLIQSLSLCHFHLISITLSLSFNLYHSVSSIQSLSLCFFHLISITLSL